MSTYLREQSAGDVLRATVSIYRRNFLTLYGMYLLPTFPFVLLKLKTIEAVQLGYFYALWVTIWALVTPFAAAVLTVGISDICIGNRPSIARSTRRIFSRILLKLVLTNLFVFIIMAGAFVPWVLALKISGIPSAGYWLLFAGALVLTVLLLIWWMFVPTIVALEQAAGWTALKRSKSLGKGFYVRNFGVLLLLSMTVFVLGWIVFGYLQISQSNILKVLGVALEAALAPLPLIATVLLYYDLRVRSEGYDLTMLGQDLKR